MILAACITAASLLCAGLAAQPPRPADEPSATISAVTVWTRAGVTSASLSNGVDAHIRPMSKAGAGRVLIAVLIPGVELEETSADRGSIALAVESMAPAPGAAKVKIGLRPEGLLVTAACAATDLAAALEQVAATIAEPRFDEAAFDSARQRSIDAYDAWLARPDYPASAAMLGLLAPGNDARLQRPTADQLRSARFQEATDRLKSMLARRAIDVSVVGDLEAKAALPMIKGSFGKLAARDRDRLIQERNATRQENPQGTKDRVVRGLRSSLAVSLPAPSIAELTESRTASVATRLMERQIAEALRGAGYKIQSSAATNISGRVFPELGSAVGSFLFSAAATQPDLNEAARVARGEIARLVQDGPTDEQLKAAVRDALASTEPTIESAEYWSHSLVLAWFLRVPVEELGTAPEAFRAVSSEQLHEYIARWWKLDRVVTVTILPTEPPQPERKPTH